MDLYNDQYSNNVFNHHEEEYDLTKHSNKFYEFIIENGFLTFILINAFVDNKDNLLTSDDV